MTLEKATLQKLSNWKHAGDQRRTLAVADADGGWSLTVAADRCDELGCLVWELTFQRSAGALVADGAGLRAWADRVASRVTGLLEPLRVVEVDAQRLEAQLRSQSPISRDGQEYYYEVLLRAAGTACVRRYQAASPGNQRQQVLFTLTHEVLAKLAGDLTKEK